MMEQGNINVDHTPVQPIDFEGGLAEALRGEPATMPATDRHVWLVDPTTRRLIGTPISESLSAELRAVFDRIEARGDEEVDRAHAEADRARREASNLRQVVFEAGLIASDIRALTYLFDRALNDDDDAPAAPLEAAGRIVAECMRSLAARLDALEVKADVVYAAIL